MDFLFESAVAGAIPIIRPMKQCLAVNDISEVVGIVNGTTNYILTKMTEEGMDFSDALEKAQELGFEYGIVKSPYWEGTEKKGFATSTPVLINPKTEKLDAAWDLMTYLCGEEGAKIVAESMLVPGYMSDEIMTTFKESTGLDESSMEALTDNISYGLGEASVNLGQKSSAVNEEL